MPWWGWIMAGAGSVLGFLAGMLVMVVYTVRAWTW